MAFEQVVNQLRGGGSAVDYRGMTPEQIAGLAGQQQTSTAQAMQFFTGLHGQQQQQQQFDASQAQAAKLAADKMRFEAQKETMNQEWKAAEFALKQEAQEATIALQQAQTGSAEASTAASRASLRDLNFSYTIMHGMSQADPIPTDIGMDLRPHEIAMLNSKGMPVRAIQATTYSEVLEIYDSETGLTNHTLVEIGRDGGEMSHRELGAAKPDVNYFRTPNDEILPIPEGQRPPDGSTRVPTRNIDMPFDEQLEQQHAKDITKLQAQTADPKFFADLRDQFFDLNPQNRFAVNDPKSPLHNERSREYGRHIQESLQNIWQSVGDVRFDPDGPNGPGFYVTKPDGGIERILHSPFSQEFLDTLRQ